MNTSPLSDRAVSYLRTVIPVAWGSLVGLLLGWVAPHLPGELGAALANLLGGEAALALVSGLAIAGWYALWRRVEKRIPDCLTRIVLGSAAAPSYSPVVAVLSASGVPVPGLASDQPDGTPVVARLTDHERVALANAHDLLPADDPGRDAITTVLDQARTRQ
ncbi:hypothetical protein [Sanguibacter antarcticus]|uniref:Uncharacterized protein n=1 Tax=Sanguibacter antarcticus TaxID=372484 RepID=A0A2A9E5K3_9MICO|nr:hypothetical protein [Sanguibacter antarcticus]PFG33645.1 hypothetical protein ATL42_1528 [Sanguibacter antarcticus]